MRRILLAKARVGLLTGGGHVQPDWRDRVRTDEAQALARRIAEQGPVLVRDDDGALAALAAAPQDALLVTLVDKEEGQGAAFVETMGCGDAVRLSPKSTSQQVQDVVAKVGAAEHVVVALYVKVRAYSGGVAIPPKLQPVLDALAAQQKVTVVSFGNPYLVQGLPHADAYVAAFCRTETVQRAVADKLRGRATFTGRLPVGIPGIAPAGSSAARR